MPKWKARCVNKRDLVKAVVLRPELMDALKVDIEWLSDYRNAFKDGIGLSVGGVEFYQEDEP